MPPPAPLQPQIEAIFNDAQQSLAKHRRCAERLRALQRKADAGAFAEALFACIACVLPVFKREPAAERVVEYERDIFDQQEITTTHSDLGSAAC